MILYELNPNPEIFEFAMLILIEPICQRSEALALMKMTNCLFVKNQKVLIDLHYIC